MNLSQWMGLRVTQVDATGVSLECAMREEFRNPDGTLHGGIIAALADEAVWHAMARTAGIRRGTTTELKVNYLRPIFDSSLIRLRAELLKAGRTLCVGTVELSDGKGKLCAFATVTYMVLEGKISSV